jgi:rSAM/selenodomain-associated transferase 2
VLSIVIPTLDAARCLPRCLEALGLRTGATGSDASGANDETEVVVADGGSRDGTPEIARACGARVIACPPGRGAQLAAGAKAARGEWLFFLHADTALGTGWRRAADAFMADAENESRAAAFRFALDDPSRAARRIEWFVLRRCRWLRLPYGDQGLLVSRAAYTRAGGFAPLPLMEDVDLVRRIGRSRIVLLDVPAVTAAERYRRGGYFARPLRNLACLSLYVLGLPPRLIARLYG